MRTPGEVTPLHILKEIRKMWLKGLSAPSLEEFFSKKYPNQKGLSKNNLDSIVQRLKTESIRNVPKFSKTEITNRPVIIGKNQEGLSKAQEILNNPQKRQAFKKFANTPGVTLDQIRTKSGVSNIHQSGLRTLIKKPIETGGITQEIITNRKKALNYLKTLSPGSDVNANRIANKTSHSVSNLKHALEQPEIKAKKFNMIPFEGKNFLSSEKFKELFKKFQKEQPPTILKRTPESSNAAFAKTLNAAGYTARGDVPWSPRNVGSRINKLNLERRTSPTPIDITKDVKKYNIDPKGLSQAAIIQKIRNARKQEMLKIRRQDPGFREHERKRAQKYQESLSKEEKQKILEKKRTSGKARMFGLVPVDYYHPKAKGFLWRDLIDNALRRQHGKLENSHIKFLRKTDRSSLTSIPKTEKVKLVDLKVIDPKTGKPKIITYDNVFEHIDENKSLYGTDSERVISEYQKKRIIQNNPDLRDRLNRIVFKDRYDPTDWKSRRFMAPGVVHHTRGRANNAFNVQFAINPENKREAELRRIFETDFRDAGKSLRGKVDAMKNYLGSVEKEIPNIEVGFNKKSYGERELFPQTMKRTGGAPIAQLVKDLYKQPEFKSEFENVMNEVAGRKICRDGCFIKVGKQNPGLLQRTLQKLAGKGGRLGAILAGAGAVGAGAYAMFGGPDARADEPRTTDQDTMTYNSTTGTFDNIDGDPENQEGILNWIADNPAKAGFSALPAWMGLGYGLSTAGMKQAGAHLMSWKAIIPAMMIPEKMHQWKTGMEAGEMATDPFNALWALGIRSKGEMAAVKAYYDTLPADARFSLKGLKSAKGWKDLPKAFRGALMSPAAKGTDLAFQKRLKPTLKKLTESIIGSPVAKETAKKGLGALAKRVGIGLGAAALLPATVAAGLVSAPLTLGLGALSFGYAQYKDYRDGKAIVDAMRAKGKISEEDADKYMSLIKQGSLPFGLGNRLFGDDEMTIRGQALNPEQQRQLLAGMEDQIDLFQDQRKEVRALDREDDFDFFSEGGRVGMKFGGGMDRRGFLKWLAGLAAGIAGGTSGLFKTGAKKGIEQVVKQAPKKFIGVEGMPAWFPRAVQKIKTHGKLIEMADRQYVNGDIYEMILPTQVPKFDMVAGKQKMSGFQTVNKRVLLEENPISGEIEMSWNVDDFDGSMKRQINFKPGESGFQKFGVDDAPGAWEYHRVKVEDPEFTYGNPDQSTPMRDEFDYKDIFEEGDEVVKALEDLTGNKKMVAKDGSIIDTVDEKGVDEAFQKKMYKDIEGEEAFLPDPEGHMTPDGWSGDKGNPIIGGEIPKDLKKKASGGTVETGDIARRQSLVPPLSGPDPQGIMGLYSQPKQVRVG